MQPEETVSVSSPGDIGMVEMSPWKTKQQQQQQEEHEPQGTPLPSNQPTNALDLRNPMSLEELNAAYESLEKMRRLNLEVECHGLNIACDYETCVLCLLASADHDDETKRTVTAEATTQSHTGGLLSLRRLRKHQQPIDKKKKNKPLTKGIPCLICGDPVCKHHSSSTFGKEKLTLCLTCEQLFQLDFSPRYNEIKDATTTINTTSQYDELQEDDILHPCNRAKLEQQIDQMVGIYDRCWLLLEYSAQFIPQLAARLRNAEVRNNKFKFGASSAGFLSGGLTLASATTLLAPVGAPLILASVVLAGGSLVAQGGNAAANRKSQTKKLADKIIAYHGMILSILQAAHSLRIRILAIQSQEHIRNEQRAMMVDAKPGKQGQIKGDQKNSKQSFLKTMSMVGTVKTSNDVAQFTATGLKVGSRVADATTTTSAIGTASTIGKAAVDVGTTTTTASMAAASSTALATTASAAADTANAALTAADTASAAMTASTTTTSLAAASGTALATTATAADTANTAMTAAASTTTALADTANAAMTTVESGATATSAAATTTANAAAAGGGAGSSSLMANVTTAGGTAIIGTAFSLAMMALAARTASSTLKKIQAGNPCDKADTLQTIETNLASLPESNDLDTECRSLLSALCGGS